MKSLIVGRAYSAIIGEFSVCARYEGDGEFSDHEARIAGIYCLNLGDYLTLHGATYVVPTESEIQRYIVAQNE